MSNPEPPDWRKVRAEFPSLANWTFLNTATFGQLPRRATEAVAHHFAHRDELACADFVEWFDQADRVRASAAKLIGAEAADIAFIPTASHALAQLINGIDWRPGDRIVTLDHEFPNQIYRPALLEKHGVEFVETPWERFAEVVDERTRLVAISAMSYLTGFRPPVEEIGKICRERGALFYLDGTQGCGAFDFDMAAIRPDVFAVHGYKWMLAPNGIGFMYVAPRVREWLEPAVVGWRSDRNWREVDHLRHGAPEFSDAAEKYEAGMLAHSLIFAMGASLDLFHELGMEAIERRVIELARRTRATLEELGGEFLPGPNLDSPDHSPILAAKFAGRDASALSVALKSRGVLVSARHGRLRVSPHFYNDESDIARLGEELRSLLT